jgi:hypothetical protein
VTVVCGLHYLACQHEFFINNPFAFKENDEHTLDFAFSPVSPFSVSVSLDFACAAHAIFPERLSNHCQGLCGTSSEICTKFDAVPLPDPQRNRIRPDIQLQIKGRKNYPIYPKT